MGLGRVCKEGDHFLRSLISTPSLTPPHHLYCRCIYANTTPYIPDVLPVLQVYIRPGRGLAGPAGAAAARHCGQVWGGKSVSGRAWLSSCWGHCAGWQAALEKWSNRPPSPLPSHILTPPPRLGRWLERSHPPMPRVAFSGLVQNRRQDFKLSQFGKGAGADWGLGGALGGAGGGTLWHLQCTGRVSTGPAAVQDPHGVCLHHRPRVVPLQDAGRPAGLLSVP